MFHVKHSPLFATKLFHVKHFRETAAKKPLFFVDFLFSYGIIGR